MLIFYGILACCFGFGLAMGAIMLGKKVDETIEGGSHRPENRALFDKWFKQGYEAGLRAAVAEYKDDDEVLIMGNDGPKLVAGARFRDQYVPTGEILDGTPHPEFVGPYAESDVAFTNAVSAYPEIPEEWVPKGVRNMHWGAPKPEDTAVIPMTNSRGPQGLTLEELDNRILGLQGRDPEQTIVVKEQIMFDDPPHHVVTADDSHPLGSQPCCEGLGDAYR